MPSCPPSISMFRFGPGERMSDTSQVEALGALYQGEKTDSIGIFNISMLMLAIAVGYVGTSLSLSGDFGDEVSGRSYYYCPSRYG